VRPTGPTGGLPCRLVAPAKLTVSLRVTGRRSDGYHLLDAEMVSLDLGDELLLAPGDGLVVEDEVIGGLGLGPIDPGPDNLVARALRSVDRRVRVVLRKRIPAGAGLGGGSADAAAVLRWAGVQDLALAARLGADVPFCLRGGRARVTGVGEQVEPLLLVPRTFLLLLPPLGVSTVACYRRWDELGGPEGPAGNDLEPAALALEPRLAAWRDLLGELSGQQPRLAGSGSTWFAELPDETSAQHLVADGNRVVTGPDGQPGLLVIARAADPEGRPVRAVVDPAG
jgi:4-diphosphocytidyl-2-C-methyl-D-erythritol kinase